MSLIQDIKSIQRAVGAEVDGIFGPRTAAAVLRELSDEPNIIQTTELDARTATTLSSLDAKARDAFVHFTLLAKATAATLGCDYIAISGTRTMERQAELKALSDQGGPHAAAPGYSWHNFGTAVDYGVFQAGGKTYCDDSNPALAMKVHAACAVHARDCGLEWGGAWKGRSCDPPHYQISMGHSSPTAADRAKFKMEGSVL